MYTEGHQAVVEQTRLNAATISVSGYKHAVTVILSATIINPNAVIYLHNVPKIDDVKYMSAIIKYLGGQIEITNNLVKIDTSQLREYLIPEQLSHHIHGAVYFLPTMLGRFGHVKIGNCGGFQIGENTLIGSRPIEHMLSVLEKFGAKFHTSRGKIIGNSPDFRSCTINIMEYSSSNEILTGPLVSGATKTAILAAATVKVGKTIIINPYPKPDVTELLSFLKVLGYDVRYWKNMIEISRNFIPIGKYRYSLMSDISQIMTYICLAIYHEISLTIVNVTVEKVKQGLAPEIVYLNKMGIYLTYGKGHIKVYPSSDIVPTNIDVTSIGIYSDHQPFFALMLLRAPGKSQIKEYVWKKRFNYAVELKKLELDLKINNGCLEIYGSTSSVACDVELIATDLRAAAVLLIAALAVPVKVRIKGVHHLSRGYDHFISTLQSIGASIRVIKKNASIEVIT